MHPEPSNDMARLRQAQVAYDVTSEDKWGVIMCTVQCESNYAHAQVGRILVTKLQIATKNDHRL